MADKYLIDKSDGGRIWSFGPHQNGPNLLFDVTRGVQYLTEVKDTVAIGFQTACKEGVLCGESM